MLGRVKFYSPGKQYGFIWTEAGDFFFRAGDVIGHEPRSGDTVEFWLTDDPRRQDNLLATEVRIRKRS